jgi:hypothetical protein
MLYSQNSAERLCKQLDAIDGCSQSAPIRRFGRPGIVDHKLVSPYAQLFKQGNNQNERNGER